MSPSFPTATRLVSGQRSPMVACRRGFTLLELLMTMALISIFIALTSARLGAPTLANVGSRADARRLAVDLLHAQRMAIATGDNHYVRFAMSGGNATGFSIYRRDVGGDVIVQSLQPFSQGVQVTPSHTDAEFTFEGAALAAYQTDFAGNVHTWRVSVVPVTGTVRMSQL